MAIGMGDTGFKVEVHMSVGGRRRTPLLSGYRAEFVKAGGLDVWRSDGRLQWEGEPLAPGGSLVATLKPAVPGRWGDIAESDVLAMFEGPHSIGSVTILERLEPGEVE